MSETEVVPSKIDILKRKALKIRRLRLVLICLAAAIFTLPMLVWVFWADITLQDPCISQWRSPADVGTIYVDWNHTLRPFALVFIAPKFAPEPLSNLGLFDDDDTAFDAVFFWSRDGQVFAAFDMPQWYRTPDDPNGNEVNEPIYTHAYDFSTGECIGHAGRARDNATQFLQRHGQIERLMAAHGGRGVSFNVEDIRSEEHRMGPVEWWRWKKKKSIATDLYAIP